MLVNKANFTFEREWGSNEVQNYRRRWQLRRESGAVTTHKAIYKFRSWTRREHASLLQEALWLLGAVLQIWVIIGRSCGSSCSFFCDLGSLLQSADEVAIPIHIVHATCCWPELGAPKPRCRERSVLPGVRLSPWVAHQKLGRVRSTLEDIVVHICFATFDFCNFFPDWD